MARIRTIKPEFWRDESLSLVSAEAALLAIGLLNHADDDGYFNANPKLIEADVFPLRELSHTTTVLLQELHSIGYIELFRGTDGKKYGHIVNFAKHQVINKKNDSKIKGLIGLPEDYGSDTVELPVGKERNRERNKEQGIGKEQGNGGGAGTAVTVPEILEGFDEFWNAYDKKVEKPAAEKAWRRIKPDNQLLYQIITAVRSYVKATPEKAYRKNPSTWLNNQCWNDEVVYKNPLGINKQEALEERNRLAGEEWLRQEEIKNGTI